MDILSEMSSVYYELTTSEKRIAEYILDHTDEVQMMSISELAEACHVGEATITRFCKRFHSRGYTALKIELVKLSHPSYEPFSDSQESETTTDSTAHQNVGGMLYGEYSAAMKQTAELLKKEQVVRAGAQSGRDRLLHGTGRLHADGGGSSASVFHGQLEVLQHL